MTASQLIAEVQRIVQDPTAYPADVVLGFLNLALNDVSSWNNINSQLGLVGNLLLPALESSEEVTTSTTDNHVAMPSTYQKNLYSVTYEDQTQLVEILTSMREFLDTWSENGEVAYAIESDNGPVMKVTVMGDQLYYRPIPEEATTLTLWFYAKPTTLAQYDPAGEDTDDIPSCIPVEFHRDLLVNYALKEIFDEIEDGVEGPKVNTLNYRAKYQLALQRLYWSIKHKSIQKAKIRRRAIFF